MVFVAFTKTIGFTNKHARKDELSSQTENKCKSDKKMKIIDANPFAYALKKKVKKRKEKSPK